MKKKYQSPVCKSIALETSHMLAASPAPGEGTVLPPEEGDYGGEFMTERQNPFEHSWE